MRATSSASMPAGRRSKRAPAAMSASHTRVASVPRHPDFVAEIARVAGARDVDRNAGDASARDSEILQRLHVGLGHLAQQRSRRRTLHRERRDGLRHVFDRHVESDGILHEPSQARIGGGPAIALLPQPRHRPVIDDFALLVAPGRVDDLADRQLRRIARDQPIDEPRRVAAGDDVFVKRRHVDERSRVADGVVFVLVMRFVRADGVVARPVAVVQALAERERALVKRGADRHQGRL